MTIDEQMMRRCLELGRIAMKNGDAPVGSVIVKKGEIIAQNVEAVKAKNDPTAHAEIETVRSACGKLQTLDLSDCVLYTNVEPCWMCSYAIRQTRLGRVVFGSRNEKVGGFSSGFQVLSDRNLKLPVPQIEVEILHEECKLLLAEFQKRENKEMTTPIIKPPFTLETALAKVQTAEDAWNTKDPGKVCLAYTIDTKWRNRTEFINGREEVKQFLERKWAKELDYKLKKELWGFRNNRMAVRFEYEWRDQDGQWFRSYGNELWEFDESGLMQRREASINDLPIAESERRLRI